MKKQQTSSTNIKAGIRGVPAPHGAKPKLIPLTSRPLVRWAGVGVVVLALGGLGYGLVHFSDQFFSRTKEEKKDPDPSNWPAPKLNASTPPGPAPEGMVWIPGGEFYMGYENAFDSNPLHLVYVDGFWMDKNEVTNEEWAKFVDATGYKTVAELPLDPKDFPLDAQPKDLSACSIVFKKPNFFIADAREAHKNPFIWWERVNGACWKHPEGPGSDIQGKEKYPVVHVCWHDAVAYCKWAKKRLPTEAEWEFAARGGLDRKEYCWGEEKVPEKSGKHLANYWQGHFPNHNDQLDGFYGTAPVGSYPPNGYGLHDMAGNVWEWCDDWYQPDYYRDSPEKNPRGPISGFDPVEQGTPKRVQRGGSFLCADNYCMRYLPGTRGKGEPKSAQNHVGFRCVKSP